MKCPKCGHQLPADSEFCQYCGGKLEIHQSVGALAEKSLCAEKPTICESTSAIGSDTDTNEQSEIEMDSSAPGNSTNEAIPSAISPIETQQKSRNNSKKEIHCKKCGAIIDNVTKKCTACGKQFFRAGTTVPIIMLAVLLVISIGMNIMYYNQSREAIELEVIQAQEIESLTTRIGYLKTTVTNQRETIASLEGKAEVFDTICEELSFGNIGYAANNFKSSESIILVDKNETNRKFTLTANWAYGGNVSVDYSDFAAFVSFDNNSWTTSTNMTVEPFREGVTAVTFSNDVDSKTFKILIIVIDQNSEQII